MSRGGRDFATRKVVSPAEVEPDQSAVGGEFFGYTGSILY